jgi:hypothetical protein
MGGMAIDTCQNEIWLKKKMSACVFARADRREVRRTDGGEGGKEDWKGHGTIVIAFLTPTLPRFLRAMPFVEVAMGLRAGIPFIRIMQQTITQSVLQFFQNYSGKRPRPPFFGSPEAGGDKFIQ